MLQIAKVLKSNGTAGDVLVGLRGCDARDLKQEEPVYIGFDGLPVPFFIDSIQPKGTSKAVVHLTDVSTLADAEELVGRFLCIEGEEESELEEDFTGWSVYDRGRLVGKVDGLEDIPGNPCLIVGDALIPLHEDLIDEVDPEAQVIRFNLPEGLA